LHKGTTQQQQQRLPNSPPNPNQNVTPPLAPTGLTFAQQQGAMAGNDGVLHERITCFNCNAKGHYASTCPNGARVQLAQATDVSGAIDNP